MAADYIAHFLGMRGVISAGVGLDAQGNPVIRVLVDRATYDPRQIPESFDGVPVVVEFSRPARLFHAPHIERARPVRPGVSCGSALFPSSAGTIGGIVVSGSRAFLVSCNHVLALNDPSAVNQTAFQPALIDGGVDPPDGIGTVTHFDPIELGIANRRDIAIADLFPAPVEATPLDFIQAPLGAFRAPLLGAQVFKSGRTTGFTAGQVAEVDAVVNVDFGPALGILSWTGTIRVTGAPFTQGGDSGSWAFDNTMAMVGMVFAGNEDGTAWLINPLEVQAYIAERLGATPSPGVGKSTLLVPALVFVGVLALSQFQEA